MSKSRKQLSSKRRFGAFLRLYGPKAAPTHAALILTRDARRNTPEAFHEELSEERRLEQVAANSYHGGIEVALKARLDYGF